MTDYVDILSVPQRQSPLAMVFLAIRTIRQVGTVQILLVLGFVLARTPSILAFSVVILLAGFVSLVIAAVQWWRYTFSVIDGELRVQRGVLSQQRLTIPLDRVQSVTLEQKLLHRPLALVQVELNTAGAQTTEFTIDAIERRVAQALQTAAADYRRAEPTAGGPAVAAAFPADRPIVAHSASRVLTVALTQMPLAGLVLIAPLFAVADDIRNVVPFDIPRIDEPSAGWWLLWAIPLIVLIGLLFSVVLNLIRVVLTDWNLTLTATEAGLRRTAGLLSTTSVASSLARVQRFSIRQGVLERIPSLHTVTLTTVGSTNFVLPGCDLHQVADVRALALDNGHGVAQLDRRVSSHEVFLRTRNAAAVSAVVALGLSFFIGAWALIVFVRVPLVWLAVRRRVALRRWGLGVDAIADHHQFLGWSRHELLLRKVNGIVVRQSFFERRRDLATVRLETASGGVSIGMIPVGQATALRDHTLHRVETDDRPWM